MDGIANVAKQQQTQVDAQSLQQEKVIHNNQQVQNINKQVDLVKQMQESSIDSKQKINSEDQVKKLVEKLNDALSPFNTNIKFGVDNQDIFYVAVIEAKTNKMIRRFPAEEAQRILPKMQEVKGVLFDSKG